MRVVRNGSQFIIKANYYSPALNAACRSVPGMSNLGGNAWGGYVDAMCLVAAKLEAGGIRGVQAFPLRDALEVGDPLVPLAGKDRRPYQLEAVKFLLDRKRALLADTMGLGKTCSALTAARALASRTLVVCPSYVRGVWADREIAKWWPDAASKIFLPKGIKEISIEQPWEDAQVVVIHYDILYAWREALADWNPRVVIFDECQALMGESSQRSNGARHVSRSAEMVWGLSGTPMTNRPRDLWNVVDILCPGRFGNFFQYGLRYCNAHKSQVTPTKCVWVFDGKSNEAELRQRLETFMIRRTVADVGLQLPPKTRQIVPIQVPAKAALSPNAGAREMRESLSRAADAKMTPVFELVKEHAIGGHKVVVFCYRRSVADQLADAMREAGVAAETIHGGVPALRRGLAIERLRGASGGGVLACTIDSTSTGIDLSFADVAVFAEITYEPHELLQCEARLHRFGQTSPVLIQYCIAMGTTEELISQMVIDKLDTFAAVVGSTGESLGSDLRGTDEDVLAELYAAIEAQKPVKKKRKAK